MYLVIHMETTGLSKLSLVPFSCCCCWFFGNVVISPFCPRLFLVFRWGCVLCEWGGLEKSYWQCVKVLLVFSLILVAAEYLCVKDNRFSFTIVAYFLQIGTWARWLLKRSPWQSNYKLTRKYVECQSVPRPFSLHFGQSCYQQKLIRVTMGERPKL